MRELLLDTHAFIWSSDDEQRLPLPLKEEIEKSDRVFVSIASFWEMAIKIGKGKLVLKDDFSTIESRFERTPFTLLPILISDTVKVQTLPPHHKDPFDRIIIAQALNRSLRVVSRDVAFDAYEVQRVWDI